MTTNQVNYHSARLQNQAANRGHDISRDKLEHEVNVLSETKRSNRAKEKLQAGDIAVKGISATGTLLRGAGSIL